MSSNSIYLDGGKILTVEEIATLLGAEYHGQKKEKVLGLCDKKYLAPNRLLVIKEGPFSDSWLNEQIFFLIDEKDIRVRDLLKKNKKRFFTVPSKKLTKCFLMLLTVFCPEIGKKHALLSNDFSKYKEMGITIHPSAVIEPGVVCGENTHIGKGARIGANVVLGSRVSIGNDCIIYPSVVIYDHVSVGNRCILHAGTVLGSDGFGYESSEMGIVRIPQIGRVILQDDVEVGANVAIDRATISVTKIEDRVKIDNLVQVAHNVEIKSDTIVVAQAGIAGSSVLGRGVVVAGQVGIADHCTIGDRVQIGAQSGVPPGKSISAGSKVMGSPATDIRKFVLGQMGLRKLAEEKSR